MDWLQRTPPFRLFCEFRTMRTLDLDFRRQNHRTKWLGIAILTAGIAAAAIAGLQHMRLAEELALAQTGLRQSENAARRQGTVKSSAAQLQQLERTMKRAREVASALKLPWHELFAGVEAAKLPGVALLSIESDSVKRQLKITGEAKDLQSMLEYVHLLGQQPKLVNTYLQSHQVQQQDPQHPVRFVLGTNWVSGK